MSINEESLRYSESRNLIYCPDKFYPQSTNNKQGSETESSALDSPDIQSELRRQYLESCAASVQTYENLLSAGVSRETARSVLPLCLYSRFVYQQNLHNLLHFLGLRLHPHAQSEIRAYAWAIYEILKSIYPNVIEAFDDYQSKSVSFSAVEQEYLAGIRADRMTDREVTELESKLGRLGWRNP